MGNKETREAYRRPWMHSRLGKVRRLGKPIGDQEDMNHAGRWLGRHSYIGDHRSIVQGRSFSYGCYGFGRTTFQPIKWQSISIIQSVNLCKLGLWFILTRSWARVKMATNRLARFEEIPKLPASLHQPSRFVFLKQPFRKLRLFIDCFKSCMWFKEWPFLHYVKALERWLVYTLIYNKEYKPHSTRGDMHTIIHSVLSK